MPAPPLSLPQTLRRALAAFQAGDLAESGRLCAEALDAEPKSLDALHLAGLVAARGGKLDEALDLIGKAVALNPRHAPAHLNLGNVLKELRRPDEALASYGRALELRPDYAEAHNNLGVVLQGQGRLAEAETAYRNAVRCKPGYPAAHHHLGNALKDQGKLDDAIAAYRRALALRPDYREAHNNLGNALKEQARIDDAIACYRRALELKPGDSETLGNLGAALYEQGKTGEAVAVYQRALESKAGAMGVGARALAICRALIGLVDVPVLYRDAAEIAPVRERFQKNLDALAELAAAGPAPEDAVEQELLTECAFKVNNFLISYQEKDDRPLMEKYAAAMTRLLRPQIGEFLKPIPPRRAPRGPIRQIRVGVASQLLRLHNGAKWTYGWLSNLPRGDYEFFFYSLNGVADALTRKMAELGKYTWLPFGERTYTEALARIRADELDALIVPDIGMTPSSRIVSLTRLAPIQMMGVGHPVTSGSKTIDYFMSGELIEPPGGDAHYTETVVRLPKMGIRIDPAEAEAPPGTRAEFALPAGRTVFGSVQSLFKYLPQYDEVFTRVAREIPGAFFVFVASRHDNVTRIFAERMARVFAGAELRFEDHGKILPYMPHRQFVQLFDVIDVNLDSIGWSGGNTTALSLARDCPVVTLPGAFMRGAYSNGMLRMIGVEELAAPSVDAFVALAARLGRDRDFRAAMAAKIRANKHKLFDDMECVRFLDAFLKEKVAALR